MTEKKLNPAGVSDPDRFLSILNNPFYVTLTRLHDVFVRATVDFWAARNVRCMLLPLTTTAVSSPAGLGSDSTPVRVRMGGIDVYLADSMQFLLEYGCRLSQNGTYYLMPSFRGDPCDESHLSQFFHSEAELPGRLDDVMTIVEEYLLALTETILVTNGTNLPNGSSHLECLLKKGREAFKRITFDEAIAILDHEPAFVKRIAAEARSLTREGEQALIRKLGPFVWVTHWDHLAVPFYQRLIPGPIQKAANADLLFGIGEVVGAGERHENGSTLRRALALHEIDPQAYSWYIRLKENNPMSTSGFGMGVERFLMWVMKSDDIRDMQLLLRENGVPHSP